MRNKAGLVWGLVLVVSFVPFILAPAAEKFKVATGVRSPVYYLPMMAAEEKGLWKEAGLEGEWVPFSAGRLAYQAVAARHLSVGMATAPSFIAVVSRGLPIVMVMIITEPDDFIVWVKGDSPLKEAKDLKGARIGVSGMGGTEHAYGRLVLKVMGMEKQAKFVATGGIGPSLAAFKTGIIDATIQTIQQMINLKLAGQARELVRIQEIRPRDWAGRNLYGHRDYLRENEATMRKGVKAVLRATQFLTETPDWALTKMKELEGYTDEAARVVFASIGFSKDGRINVKGVENVRNFLIEFGVTSKEKTPAGEELYTEKFLR